MQIDKRCPWVTVQADSRFPKWKVEVVGYRNSQPNDDPHDGNDMSCNIYVLVLDKDGYPMPNVVVHQNTPENENDAIKYTDYRGRCDFFMSGDSSFAPDRGEAGPYRIYVDRLGDVIGTDTVHGLGLPLRYHVNYDIVFQATEGASTPPDGDPTTPPPANEECATIEDIAIILENVALALNEVARKAREM